MKSGILPINKPEGPSSAQVVARVKRILGAKKVGHTGTLDPFATGLLLCGINQGTRISGLFLESHKRYGTQIRLGIETDTYDSSGKVVFTASSDIIRSLTENKIRETILSFIGVQKQIPPAFSALKHKGKPLYEWARKGKPIQKPARQIAIFDISIINIAMPTIELELFCSSGTYIRSLGFDIGRKLGCGAHLFSLCRTQSGSFHLKDAVSFQELEKLNKEELEKRILPIAKCIEFIPAIYADQKTSEKIKYGKKLLKADFQAFSKPSGSKPSGSKPPGLKHSGSTHSGLSKQSDSGYSGPLIRVMDSRNENVLALVQEGKSGEEYIYSCVFAT